MTSENNQEIDITSDRNIKMKSLKHNSIILSPTNVLNLNDPSQIQANNVSYEHALQNVKSYVLKCFINLFKLFL